MVKFNSVSNLYWWIIFFIKNKNNDFASFNLSKSKIVSSALGIALGLTSNTTIADVTTTIESVTNNGAVSKTITPSTSAQSYTVPKGYHDGTGKVTVNAAPVSLINGNATAANVLDGKTFFSDSYTAKTGTMTDNSGTTKSATGSLDSTNSRLQLTVPANGYYNTSAKLYASYSSIRTLIGLTAAKIVKGNTILGLAGTATKAGYDLGNYLKGLSSPITIESQSSSDFTATMMGKMIRWVHPSSSKNTSNFKTANFDITGYTKLSVSYILRHTSDKSVTITLKTTSGGSVTIYSNTATGADGSKTVDISSLTGTAYIHVYTQSKGGYYYLSDLYLS